MKLWNKDVPIIASLLENDVYKFMMMNYIHRYYPNLHVTFNFLNRTRDVLLPQYIDVNEIQAEVNAVEKLEFTDADIAHLGSWALYPPHYLKSLKKLKLETPRVLEYVDGATFHIQASGSWFEETLWEMYVLAIVSELWVRGYAKHHGISEVALIRAGEERLMQKVSFFKQHPRLRIAQFGMRRRASGLWERRVTEVLLNECPGLITGVSNVQVARELGIEAQGTNAHELPMAVAAFLRHASNIDVRNSVYRVLKEWQELYGLKALIMLPDTFGTDAFLAQLPHEYAIDWRGFRQDSGDPIAFGELVIRYYEQHGIDPTEKLIIFSDGLTPERMVTIEEHFRNRIGVAFGVGTNLTNDLGLIKPLSLVMKIVEAAGNPAVKLSDNVSKATGNPTEVEVMKRIFGYTNTFTEATVY